MSIIHNSLILYTLKPSLPLKAIGKLPLRAIAIYFKYHYFEPVLSFHKVYVGNDTLWYNP